jgi:DivIVA domain-containing protein
MPDQSSASTEHALMQEITAPLSTLPDDPVPAVSDVDFPLVLRGYDRDSVDAYVASTSQLVAELQATRSPEVAVRRALERVGEEVSGILQRAHETASRITTQSRSEAEDRLETARQEAAQIVSRAEERVRELDAETDRIWAERHRIVEDTRELARELLGLTDSAADRFPPDAAGLGDDALPGLEAVPPAGIEASNVDTPGIEAVPAAIEGDPAVNEAVPAASEAVPAASEAVPAAPEAVEPGETAPEDAASDTEPTAILPVLEPVEWVEPATEDAEDEDDTP